MTRHTTVALVLIAGIAAGTGVATAGREQTTRTAPLPPLPPPAQTAPQRLAGPARIVARAADPNGGPQWAVRRLPIAVSRDPRSQGTSTTPLTCLQLGRVQDGRFGWISDGYAFTPVDTGATVVPQICSPAGAPMRGRRLEIGLPGVLRVNTIEGVATGAPRPSTAIVFGDLPPGSTRVRLTDGTVLIPQSGRTALAAVAKRRVGAPALDGVLSRTGRPPLRFRLPEGTERFGRGRRKVPQPEPGTQRLAVRTPDPAGGAAWGLLTARTLTDDLCLSSPDRLVGSTPSMVDSRLGIAAPSFFSFFDCRAARAPSAAHPLRVDTGSYAVHDEDPTLTAQLRRPVSRLVLYGRTTPSVTSVTIRSPRDIRTVKPAPGSGAFIAVYDGTFQNQSITVTAHLPGGRTVSTTRRSF